ncbi:stage V sporulation protein B [Desulfotomaculum arcticum]|uniref:Stage V sporulation protein B n=1 Tax=Desulfotruncus arcticus DSM 17038 TaxID=1121424 RepID=A0A1I2S6H3_9FIRM|nr:stage V sporulation protein B [Desulfotruncus arcticus]SFG45591.1 stage V sporulation protein B [Desulfotomaculum arcticum] [Desulfotruncus arcticus DSM 17038]
MANSSFLKGAMVLLAAGLINRLVGFLYQIGMMRLIGPEGVGLFNMVFPVYIMVLVLATAGIPLAISKLVAEEVAKKNLSGAYRIFKISFLLLAGSSIFFTTLLLVGAPFFKNHIFANPKVYNCFLCLIPGVLIVSISSAFRGFFQGLQQMGPTAVTQTIEQLVRVCIGLFFASLMLPRGIEYAAVGLSLGVVVGELTGLIFMLSIYSRHRPRLMFGNSVSFGLKDMLTRIFNLAIPVTLTRFVATALMSVQAVMIPQRLYVSGLSLSQATKEYGQLVGIAESLLFIPGVVTIALATALVPAMSDAVALKNLSLVRIRIIDAVRIVMQVGVPAAVFFLILADELCGVLFGYPMAGASLKILALSGPFLYLQQAITGILQGIGRADIPFKNLLLSSTVSITGIYFLTAIPELCIKGSAIAIGTSFIIMAVLNTLSLQRITGFSIGLRDNVIKPVTCSMGMYAVINYVKVFLNTCGMSEGFILFASLFLGSGVYMVLMLISGGINNQDKEKFKKIFRFKNL